MPKGKDKMPNKKTKRRNAPEPPQRSTQLGLENRHVPKSREEPPASTHNYFERRIVT